MKSILTIIIFLSLVVSGATQTRNVVVGTNGAVVSPTNFWSVDVTNARSGLGLGTAATNPASAFQPSSLVLSNLASNNAVNLTNLRATNIVGTLSITQGGTGSTNAADARTAFGLGTAATNPASAFQLSSAVLSNLATSNGANITNIPLSGVVGALGYDTNGNVIYNGTNALNFTNVNINLTRGAGTNDLSLQVGTNLTGFYASASGSNTWAFVFNGAIYMAMTTNGNQFWRPISFNNTTNADATRTNLGVTTVGNAVFTATNAAAAATAIGLGTTNNVTFNNITIANGGSLTLSKGGEADVFVRNDDGDLGLYGDNAIVAHKPIYFTNNNDASGTRTNLGLGWTGTNAAISRTNLGLGTTNNVVFSNLSLSNGAVTNLAIALGSTNRGFYATAGPERIVTVVGGIDALQVFSTSVETATGITLSVSGQASFGTNIRIGGPLSFIGANAVVNTAETRTNLGLGWSALTNSNAGTGLVSVNTNGDVVSPTNFWQVAPIVTKFVEFDPATNATTNVVAARNLHIHSLAISRTGVTSTIALPITNSFNGDIALVVHKGPTSSVTAVRAVGTTNNLVTMNRPEEAVEFVYYNNVWQFNHNRSFVEPIFFSGTNASANAGASRTNLGLGSTNNVVFNNIEADGFLDAVNVLISTNGTITFYGTNSGFGFSAGASASQFREDLGLPLPALTNTNNANFQAAVFATNSNPTNGGSFNSHVAWMEVTVQTNGSNVSFRIPLYK